MSQPATERTASRTGKVVYTAKTHTSGGRENGAARSSDGCLDVRLSTPGTARIGTNPEQLFAAGWSACLESAIALAAQKRNIALPGVERAAAQALVEEAHESCPYSKATRGNIDVAIKLV